MARLSHAELFIRSCNMAGWRGTPGLFGRSRVVVPLAAKGTRVMPFLSPPALRPQQLFSSTPPRIPPRNQCPETDRGIALAIAAAGLFASTRRHVGVSFHEGTEGM